MHYMIELIPLVGICFEGKHVELLAAKEKVENVLGTEYETEGDSVYYFENELRVDFDQKGRVEFIEFLGGMNGNIQPQIYGVNAFQIEADDLYKILRNKNNGDINDNENGYSFNFLGISVGIYRECTPEDVQEMIRESRAEGEPMDLEEIECETRKANHWAAIGIGVMGYYL